MPQLTIAKQLFPKTEYFSGTQLTDPEYRLNGRLSIQVCQDNTFMVAETLIDNKVSFTTCDNFIDAIAVAIRKDKHDMLDSYTFIPTTDRTRGHIGKLNHNSYDVWINVFKEVYYINGADSGMIPVGAKLAEIVNSVR